MKNLFALCVIILSLSSLAQKRNLDTYEDLIHSIRKEHSPLFIEEAANLDKIFVKIGDYEQKMQQYFNQALTIKAYDFLSWFLVDASMYSVFEGDGDKDKGKIEKSKPYSILEEVLIKRSIEYEVSEIFKAALSLPDINGSRIILEYMMDNQFFASYLSNDPILVIELLSHIEIIYKENGSTYVHRQFIIDLFYNVLNTVNTNGDEWVPVAKRILEGDAFAFYMDQTPMLRMLRMVKISGKRSDAWKEFIKKMVDIKRENQIKYYLSKSFFEAPNTKYWEDVALYLIEKGQTLHQEKLVKNALKLDHTKDWENVIRLIFTRNKRRFMADLNQSSFAKTYPGKWKLIKDGNKKPVKRDLIDSSLLVENFEISVNLGPGDKIKLHGDLRIEIIRQLNQGQKVSIYEVRLNSEPNKIFVLKLSNTTRGNFKVYKRYLLNLKKFPLAENTPKNIQIGKNYVLQEKIEGVSPDDWYYEWSNGDKNETDIAYQSLLIFLRNYQDSLNLMKQKMRADFSGLKDKSLVWDKKNKRWVLIGDGRGNSYSPNKVTLDEAFEEFTKSLYKVAAAASGDCYQKFLSNFRI